MIRKVILSVLVCFLIISHTAWCAEVKPYPAAALSITNDWINSSPLSLNKLKGNVVLLDFWAYSCINCIRTFPHMNELYEKYHDKGLVIIGVHSPEFDFEKEITNVKNAVTKYKIKYPVMLDNHFETWQAFNNQFWPAQYLINKEGLVVYTHFGEGGYQETENQIRELLGMSKNPKEKNVALALPTTPETYFGYSRANTMANLDILVKDATGYYHFPNFIDQNQWALQGEWIVYPDKIVAVKAGASMKLNFTASKVFAVMARSGGIAKVKVKLNGVPAKKITVDAAELYTLIDSSHTTNGIIELIAVDPGVELYTFTFG